MGIKKYLINIWNKFNELNKITQYYTKYAFFICAIFSVVFTVFTLKVINWNANPSDFATMLLYLFSTSAQSQAAFGGIIISVTLVGLQLISEKYNTKLTTIFLGSKTFWLVIMAYIFSILFDIAVSTIIPVNSNVIEPIFWILNKFHLIFVGFFLLYFNFMMVPFYLGFIIQCSKPRVLISYLCSGLTHEKINEKLKKEEYIFDPFEQLFKKIMHEESPNNFDFLFEYFFNGWYYVAEKNIYCDKTIDKKYYFKFNYEFFILCLSLANYAVKTKNGEYLEHIFRCIYKMFERMNKRITWNFEESNYMGDFIDDTVSKIENLSKNNGFESERESLQCILLNIYKIGLNAINIGQVKNINCNMDYCAHVLFDIYESEHITFRNLLNNLIVELIELIPKSNENRSIKYILQSISEKVDSKLKSMYSKNTMGGKIWLYRGTFIQTFEFYLIIALLQNYDDSVEEYIDEFILPLDKFLKPYGPVWQLKKLENSKKFIYLGWIEPLVSIDEYYDNFEKIKEYITKKIREKRIEDIENWKSKANKLDTLFIIDTEGNFKE